MVVLLFLCSLYFIDQPSSHVPGHAVYDVKLRLGPEGAVLGFFHVGIWDRLSLGVSYGASNLIGAGDPEFYTKPGIQIRILAIEEGFVYPSLIFGFDNQGYGPYDEGRYEIMSKGLYCQTGKTFGTPGIEFMPSIGFNYSFEENGRFDMFLGVMTQFGTSAALLIDYSPNFNDNLDQNRGYMNLALKLIFYEELFFEFALRDLLDNSVGEQQLNRLIKIGYEQVF
ncbi:MAG: hypothetical protein JSV97_12670 [candidate division WOR-3 bacterium]|nr:MAG: hypothetical protein JSV97_12670 [candidate division WOR-3 bacterium]